MKKANTRIQDVDRNNNAKDLELVSKYMKYYHQTESERIFSLELPGGATSPLCLEP